MERMMIGLFDPGMSHVHRVGLAGLHMTLGKLDKPKGVDWKLEKTRVTLSWEGSPRKALDWLLGRSFGYDASGLVSFAAHSGRSLTDIGRIKLHEAILGSFLQHPLHNRIAKGSRRKVVLTFGDKQVPVEYRPFSKPYPHALASGELTDGKGQLKKVVPIKGWMFPGAAERHSGLSSTEIEETPERTLCLLFAPVAALYYRLYHRGLDGARDPRRGTAVALPHLMDLDLYSKCYARYLGSPIEKLYADGLGDAGLMALLTLRAGEALHDLRIKGCSVVTMGSAVWAKQQQTRTGVVSMESVDGGRLMTFETALASMPNKVIVNEGKATKKNPNPGKRYWVATSIVRGHIAENLAQGREWFRGFSELMISKKRTKLVMFEKGGLNAMTEGKAGNKRADHVFVEAVHDAMRNRYGALAAQAKKRGERIPFDREFERMRVGLMRAKNAQTLRAEIADMFARGGLNKTLKREWPEILPLLTAEDWQRTRDLALLALASYSGKGAEEIEKAETDLADEEEN